MSQVNVNTPATGPAPGSNGREAVAAGFNLLSVIIILAVVLVVLAALAYYFTGTNWFAIGGGTSATSGTATAVHSAVATASATLQVTTTK